MECSFVPIAQKKERSEFLPIINTSSWPKAVSWLYLFHSFCFEVSRKIKHATFTIPIWKLKKWHMTSYCMFLGISPQLTHNTQCITNVYECLNTEYSMQLAVIMKCDAFLPQISFSLLNFLRTKKKHKSKIRYGYLRYNCEGYKYNTTPQKANLHTCKHFLPLKQV